MVYFIYRGNAWISDLPSSWLQFPFSGASTSPILRRKTRGGVHPRFSAERLTPFRLSWKTMPLAEYKYFEEFFTRSIGRSNSSGGTRAKARPRSSGSPRPLFRRARMVTRRSSRRWKLRYSWDKAAWATMLKASESAALASKNGGSSGGSGGGVRGNDAHSRFYRQETGKGGGGFRPSLL